MSTMSTNATDADLVSDPPSCGPTCASPYGTASTAGGPPELSLPPPSLKERRVSTELMVFLDPASGQPSPVRDLSNADVDADTDDSDDEDWVAEPDGNGALISYLCGVSSPSGSAPRL